MEHKVTLVVGKNGSIQVINDEEETNHWGELSSLGFLLVTSTVLNLGLAGAGLMGRAKGTLEISPLAVALSVSNTLDSMANHTLSLILLTLWPDSSPSSIICRFSAAFYLAGLLVQPLYILAHFLSKVHSRKRSALQLLQKCFLAGPVLVAMVFATPLLVLPNLIQVRHFVSRHVCCFAGESLPYSVSLILLGFVSPWATIAYCIAFRKCTCDSTHHSCGEDREFRYLIAIVMTALILVLPAVISFSVTSMTSLNHLSTYKDSDDDVVIITGTYDTVITWARFSFNLFCSLVMLVFFGDLRMECIRIWFYIKEMSVVGWFSGCYNSNNGRQSMNTASQGGPVLFVTSGGLMLLRGSADNCLPLEKCDLIELEQKSAATRNTSFAAQPTPISPVTPKIRKKWNKNAKRKIVRFAQSVKEIPHFSDD